MRTMFVDQAAGKDQSESSIQSCDMLSTNERAVFSHMYGMFSTNHISGQTAIAPLVRFVARVLRTASDLVRMAATSAMTVPLER